MPIHKACVIPVAVFATALAAFAAEIGGAARSTALTCATCHPRESAAQPGTPMANALGTPGHNLVLQSHRDLRFTSGRFTYRVVTENGESTYSVSDGTNSVSLPVKWSFGAASQTFVLERNGRFIESMVSYYPAIDNLEITIGDDALKPGDLESALGRALEPAVTTACFGCHTTRSLTAGKLDTSALIPGVTCVRCHIEAAAHLASFSHRETGVKPAIPERLGNRGAEGISSFCGGCHRTWETVVRNNWRGESNVRFQPYRLENSKCFDGADSRIGCVACHDPHQNMVKQAASYDAKCLACHGASTKGVLLKPCPVGSSACVTCHMPKVELPGGHKAFTDHQIRIVKTGEAYPN